VGGRNTITQPSQIPGPLAANIKSIQFMRAFLFSLILLNSTIVLGQSDSSKNRYSREPETNFELLVNDKKYVIGEGKELNLDTLIKPKIVVRQSSYKKLENSSLTFEYPKHLSFEFDESVGLNTWTLSGNSTLVMVFQMAGKGLLETLVTSISEKFGKKNCKIENFEKKLGAKMCKGKTLRITLVGQTLLYDCYELESSDLFSNYLFIQDSLDKFLHTTEYENILEHINSTLTYK